MTKTIKKILSTFVSLMALTVVFASCSNLSISNSKHSSSKSKAAKITLSLEDSSRAIFPTIDLSVYKYTLTATNTTTNESEELLTLRTYDQLTSNASASVDVGTYAFTVHAFSGENEILSGSTTKAVSSGSNTISIVLTESSDNTQTGSVSITVSYSKTAGVSFVYAYFDTDVPPATYTTADENLTVTLTSGTATYAKSGVASGNHYIAFYAYDSDANLLGYTIEGVYVIGGVQTTGTAKISISKTQGVYPSSSDSAYADTQLILTFTSTPSLVTGKTISIYKTSDATTAVDTITINPTSDESQTLQSGNSVNIGNTQRVRVDGNSVYIQPKYGALDWGTSYYVEIGSDAITGADTLYPNIKWSGFSGSSDTDSTKAWTFTTKTAPTLSTTLTVSNNIADEADYYSVYGAMAAVAKGGTSGKDYEIQVQPGTYHELVSVKTSGANIILRGMGSDSYGSDVVIEYTNNQHMNNGATTRTSFYFGGGNLTLENLALKNTTKRKTVYTADGYYGGNSASETGKNNYQAEALYFDNASGHLSAYNCSFISLQDTIITKGKVWVYGSHIEGDVDFMWGYSDVALFENCDIECVYDSDSNGSAYLFETRVGAPSSSTSVGKGYVLLNSTVTIDSGTTAYFARRASVYSATAYYDQAALVNVNIVANGTLGSTHYYTKTNYNPNGISSGTLYGTYADVGWKEYNVTSSSSVVTPSAATDIYGIITSAEYKAEYLGRRAILNRYYNTEDNVYVRDTTSNFAVDSLISDRKYSVVADKSSEVSSSETTYTTVIWNWQTNNVTMYNSSSTTVTTLQSASGTMVSSDDKTVVATVDASNGKLAYRSSDNDAQMNAGTIIGIPVVAGDIVTVTARSNGSYLTIGSSTSSLSSGTSYTATASGYVYIGCTTSSAYLYSISRARANSTNLEVTMEASSPSVAIDSEITITATASDTVSSDGWNWYFDSGLSSSLAEITTTANETTTSTATVKGLAEGSVNVYVVVDGISSVCTVKVLPDTITYDIDVVPGVSVTTNGWADKANGGDGMSYPNTTNIIYINDSKYATTKAKRTAFTNAIASGSVSSSGLTSTAAIIVLDGVVDLSDGNVSDDDHSYFDEFNSSTSKREHDDFVYDIGSNKTIIGVNGARIAFGGLRVTPSASFTAENIIIRNIEFWDAHGSTEYDTTAYSSSKASADNLVIEASGDPTNGSYTYVAQNIWIDHCSFSDGKCEDLTRNYNHDGSLDAKAAKYMTVSYCEFTNHDKVTLLAPNETCTDEEQRQITFHHNYYHGAIQRMPRTRACQVHIYNNYYNNIGNDGNAGYSLGPGINAQFIVENNYFGTHASYIVKYFDSSTSTSTLSKIYASGNSPTLSDTCTIIDSSVENTSVTGSSSSTAWTAHSVSTAPWTIGYTYKLAAANILPTLIPDAAGPDKAEYSANVRVNGTAY